MGAVETAGAAPSGGRATSASAEAAARGPFLGGFPGGGASEPLSDKMAPRRFAGPEWPAARSGTAGLTSPAFFFAAAGAGWHGRSSSKFAAFAERAAARPTQLAFRAAACSSTKSEYFCSIASLSASSVSRVSLQVIADPSRRCTRQAPSGSAVGTKTPFRPLMVLTLCPVFLKSFLLLGPRLNLRM